MQSFTILSRTVLSTSRTILTRILFLFHFRVLDKLVFEPLGMTDQILSEFSSVNVSIHGVPAD